MASGSGVRGEEELDKSDSRPLIPSVKDIMIYLGKHSQRMISVKNSDTVKEFIARYGFGHPANVEADGRKTSVDVIYGDEEAPRTSLEVSKRETRGKCGDVLMDTDRRATKGQNGEIMVSDDEQNVSGAEEIPCYSVDRVVPLNILPYSSHRDGSVYRDTSEWKKEYHIVDRSDTWLEAMMFFRSHGLHHLRLNLCPPSTSSHVANFLIKVG